eukprot:TRINITY_DN56817_c0_g1_i1.p1 TRINITY_DN56817_c0_g1~~TRINITY_DN56817_c0_g1_i1.p1  ORF type:complete len:342 (-),score=24.20 TRINITY_DN56817_c0_g1_i1:99-1058(-)
MLASFTRSNSSTRIEKDPFLPHGKTQRGFDLPTEGLVSASFHHSQNADIRVALVTGVYLPAFVYMSLVTSFMFLYHHMPAIPWFIALFGGTFVIIASIPHTRHTNPTCSAWLPLISCIVFLGLGLVFGHFDAGFIQPWFQYTYLARYSDVLPDADTRIVFDAGVIEFSSGTVLDIDRSAGFYAGFTMYCAAPIVSETSKESNVRAGFWAVGKNCCSGSGVFTCGSSSGTAGVRVQNTMGSSDSLADHYMKAVRKAAATNAVNIGNAPPVLLSWTNDPRLIARSNFGAALATLATQIVMALIIILSFRSLILRSIDGDRK